MPKTTPEYLSGEVLEGMSIMLPHFKLDLTSGYFQWGSIAIPVMLLAISSVLIEYVLAICFWFRRLRVVTAILGVLFHISLMWLIQIGMLDWASMLLYPVFLLPIVRSGRNDA